MDGWMRFAGKVLAAHRADGGCDVDGGDIQRWATEYGLLEEREVTEPCGDSCACAEITGFPMSCFFLTDAGRAVIAAARG